ncbi:uncharacterized protein RSE6_11783 [Rhynchosporium secalis]|uniref:Cell wall mannoprotein PIR1-like C-terminal domain-containing protein n=1 Tax=Rhynchosporium secalis TaxID=38038 RepID=A0A1E1MNR8_RHYSE|nr:uncharacterized protein RSE6_11783 [Rhynchosporium secalis]
MQTAFTLAALASVAFAIPQGGASNKAPSAPSPAGCSQNYNGDFQITVVNGSTTATPKRQASSCGKEGVLTTKLANGVLTDSKGRIGSIVANYQFQFDGPPPQAGALYTAGFSVCGNGSLAIGGSAVFYSCASGDFANLYDRAWAPQCLPVFINALPCGSGSGVGQQPDGQPSVPGTAPPVSQTGDGQPQVTSVAPRPVSQIGDGQVQGPTTAPMPVGTPVVQIGDGQLQIPTTAPKPVGTPVVQIGDGQIQAPTSAPKPAGTPVVQIGDGQIQTNVTAPKPNNPVTVGANAGNSLNVAGSMAAVMVGAAAVFLL